jgi:hypothetical protein
MYLLVGLISATHEGVPLGATESRRRRARYRSSQGEFLVIAR